MYKVQLVSGLLDPHLSLIQCGSNNFFMYIFKIFNRSQDILCTSLNMLQSWRFIREKGKSMSNKSVPSLPVRTGGITNHEYITAKLLTVLV